MYFYLHYHTNLSGTPQSAFLFTTYINDMPDVVNSLIKLFTDDSKLIGIIKNI